MVASAYYVRIGDAQIGKNKNGYNDDEESLFIFYILIYLTTKTLHFILLYL